MRLGLGSPGKIPIPAKRGSAATMGAPRVFTDGKGSIDAWTADAKEVGVENPAEETYCRPDTCIV